MPAPSLFKRVVLIIDGEHKYFTVDDSSSINLDIVVDRDRQPRLRITRTYRAYGIDMSAPLSFSEQQKNLFDNENKNL